MKKEQQEQLKQLPAVDEVLRRDEAAMLIKAHGRSSVVAAVRVLLQELRQAITRGDMPDVSVDAMMMRISELLAESLKPRLTRVVNATGIILHTGLGRAHMPDAAREALADLTGFCNVQMDLATGERIQREACIKEHIHELTGAEDAVLVNNNAGATMLVLKALGEGREVIVSRGELIEIGGSFRLPEIMEQSGATLREVGSTNKTHLKDYKKAICEQTALMLKAHKSNYSIVGFTKEVGIDEIAALGKEHGIPVVDDLGCGALVDLETYGLEHEMTVRESLEAGADLVLFSTDKLIGGPQGGLIVGRADLLKQIRSHSLYRALRVGKMTLAALESTLRLFRSPELLKDHHPVYRMLARTPAEMEQDGKVLAERLQALQPDWEITLVEEPSYLGGGSVPTSSLPAFAVRVNPGAMSTDALARQLRTAAIPVVPHVGDDAVLLNLRTLFSDEFDAVEQACKGC